MAQKSRLPNELVKAELFGILSNRVHDSDGSVIASHSFNSNVIEVVREAYARDIRCDPPIKCFEEMDLHDNIRCNLALLSIMKPTTLQKYCFPLVLQNHDLVVCSQSGGKTLCWLLPIVNLLLSDKTIVLRSRSIEATRTCTPMTPSVIVVAATVQDAFQIEYAAAQMTYNTSIVPGIAYDGGDRKRQNKYLRDVDILVATPDRLQEFIDDGNVNLKSVRFTVFYEPEVLIQKECLAQMKEIKASVPDKSIHLIFCSCLTMDEQRVIQQDLVNDNLYLEVNSILNEPIVPSESSHPSPTNPKPNHAQTTILGIRIGRSNTSHGMDGMEERKREPTALEDPTASAPTTADPTTHVPTTFELEQKIVDLESVIQKIKKENKKKLKQIKQWKDLNENAIDKWFKENELQIKQRKQKK
eukprot:207137_1